MTIWINWTSEKPRRSALEMSKTLSTLLDWFLLPGLSATYTTLGGGIDTTGSTLLESELGQNLVEASVLGEVDQFAVDTGADTSS